MTKLDTIQLTTSTDFIQSMDSKLFRISKIYKPNGLEIINHTLNTKAVGINKININQTIETLTLNLSSKILGQNYFQGICLNTLDQLTDELKKQGITLDKDFINHSSLKFLDVKNDLSLANQNTSLYFSSLGSLIAPKFTKTNYDSGITFNQKVLTNPIRSTIYDKQIEMQGKHKAFYNKFNLTSPGSAMLRFETRFSKASTIKKYFKSTKLMDVLSKSNINYFVLDKIIDNQTQFKPIINTNNMTNAEEKNYAQIFCLNQTYNGNFEQIIKHLKSKYSPNTKLTGLRKKVKKYLSIINNSNENYNIDLLNEIRENLKE